MSKDTRESNKPAGIESLPAALLAALLGFLVPGLGHIMLGRVRRGIIIFIVIGVTFWTGVAVGGVMTVDFYYERPWFVAQIMTGIHGGIAWLRQNKVYNQMEVAGTTPQKSSSDQSYQGHQSKVVDYLAKKELALVCPAADVARAYTGVAGMLSIMCVFDVLLLGLIGVRGEGEKPKRAKAGTNQEMEQ
ncbi:MAG TPA: hypothetical protein ENL03_05165 [Phycisphaerae bacterium]|nr:hypothetical protein [Phycisphaerae bacterium]